MKDGFEQEFRGFDRELYPIWRDWLAEVAPHCVRAPLIDRMRAAGVLDLPGAEIGWEPLAKGFPPGKAGEGHEDNRGDNPQGLDVDEPKKALSSNNRNGSHCPERQQRTYTYRQRRVIVSSQVGGEDLGQVAPLSQENDDECRRHNT
jgi:hypothetical protein